MKAESQTQRCSGAISSVQMNATMVDDCSSAGRHRLQQPQIILQATADRLSNSKDVQYHVELGNL